MELLIGIPGIINTFIEPGLLLLGDTRMRKALVIGGGLAILAALLMVGSADEAVGRPAEALRTRFLLCWVVLMQVADLLLDVFSSFAVLCYTGVLGATRAQAGLALGIIMAANLIAACCASRLLLSPLCLVLSVPRAESTRPGNFIA